MAKLNLNEKIKKFDGTPLEFDIDPAGIRLLEQLMQAVNDELGTEAAKKLAGRLDKYLVRTQTYKDVCITALMISDADSQEKKLRQYKLLKEIDSGEPDLGKTEREEIVKKITENFRNVIVVGRCHEFFLDEKE